MPKPATKNQNKATKEDTKKSTSSGRQRYSVGYRDHSRKSKSILKNNPEKISEFNDDKEAKKARNRSVNWGVRETQIKGMDKTIIQEIEDSSKKLTETPSNFKDLKSVEEKFNSETDPLSNYLQ